MAKIDLPNVEPWRARDGSIGGYYFRRQYRDAAGKKRSQRIELPGEPGAAEFMARYDELRQGAPQKRAQQTKQFTFISLIARYRSSPEFRDLAETTRRDYLRCLSYLEQHIGERDPRQLGRADVLGMRDANQHRPRYADYLVQVLSIVMRYAIDLEWRPRGDNPCERVRKLHNAGDGYPIWGEERIERVVAVAERQGRTAHAFAIRLAHAIGIRAGDLLRLSWSAFDGEGIDYTPSKTRRNPVPLWIPLSPEMLDLMRERKAAARGLTIIERPDNGRPFAYRHFLDGLHAILEESGDRGYGLHGLRKDATFELAEAGCSDDEIKSITGHTTAQMIRKYAVGARRKALARSAQQRRQEGRANDARTPGAKQGAKQNGA